MQKADVLIEEIEKGTAEAGIKIDHSRGVIVVTLTSEADRTFAVEKFGNDPKVVVRFAEFIAVPVVGDPVDERD